MTGPTPQSRSTGSGCRNSSSPPGGTTRRPSGFATPLATLARNLVRATPDGDRQPDLLEHVAPQPRGDLRRACPRSARARRRRGTPRRSTAPRRAAWCPRRPRTPPCSPRCRLDMRGCDDDRAAGTAGAPAAAHRGADAVRLGLVARRQHDAAARRSPGGRAAADRRAARPRRRTRRGRHGGSWLADTNTCSHRAKTESRPSH